MPDAEPDAPTEVARKEIEALHRFFEAWYRGVPKNTETAFARFPEVLAADFRIISPDGRRSSRAEVLEAVRGGHGSRPDAFRIEIRNVEAREVGKTVLLAGYEEWQHDGGTVRGWRSTAVFTRYAAAPGGLLWHHVQETGLPGTPG